MANMTRDTFHLRNKDQSRRRRFIKEQPPTHGSFRSHLSLDALHRAQDRVSLRALDSEFEEAFVLAFPLLSFLSAMASDTMDPLHER